MRYWLLTYRCRNIGEVSDLYVTTVTDKHPADYLQECIDLEQSAAHRYWKEYALIFSMEISKELFHKHDGALSS